MKVYYEFVFLLNFLLDFMILYGTKRILKINKKNYQLLLGSLIGSFTTIFLFFRVSKLSLSIVKVLFSLLINFISFGKKNIFKNTFYFYLISIILGGSFYLFDVPKNKSFGYLFLVIGSLFIIIIICREFLNYRVKIQNKYLVKIIYQKKEYLLEGFIDTGNQLLSPIKKESVILVNLKIPLKKVIYVPYKALNTSGIIPCVRPDKIFINDKEIKHCLVGVAAEKFELTGVDCILPNRIKEDLC